MCVCREGAKTGVVCQLTKHQLVLLTLHNTGMYSEKDPQLQHIYVHQQMPIVYNRSEQWNQNEN